MDNLIAIFGILVILTFFASIGTGIVFLIMRSKSPVLLKKSFYLCAGVFICSLILMLISLSSIDDSDKENVASETNQTGIEEDSFPVFSYEESSAVADANGEFSIAITVHKGLPIEFFEPASDEGATLRKIDDTHYVLEGRVPKNLPRADYYIFHGTPKNEQEERISIDNDLAYKPSEEELIIDDEQSSNESYAIDVQRDIEKVMGEHIEVDDGEVAVIDEVQVNDNAGKKDGSKIILIHLNTPIGLTSNKTQQKIDTQTLQITKAIREDSSIDFTIDSITYFWSVPMTRKDGTIDNVFASKILLEHKTIESLNYERLDGIELKQVADQYRTSIK